MTFIEQIKKIKKERGYTTEQLAAESGIPLGTLSKLFSGVISEPKLSSAVALAQALGISLDRLCGLNSFPKDKIEALVSRYSVLDDYGRELVDCILAKEYERAANRDIVALPFAPSAVTAIDSSSAGVKKAKPQKRVSSVKEQESQSGATLLELPRVLPDGIITIPLYNLPVSAGPGEYLEDSGHANINIKAQGRAAEATFALRVSGNSMEPRFSDGDIILVKEQNSVNVGQFGIFICDGTGYFKQYNGNKLVSLNPEYSDISLSSFNDVTCRGLVLGRLKSKKQ